MNKKLQSELQNVLVEFQIEYIAKKHRVSLHVIAVLWLKICWKYLQFWYK